MESALRAFGVVVLAFVLLVVQSSLIGPLVSTHPFEPNLVLPIAIYYGVTQEVYIVRGVVVSFIVGYLYDVFAGNPMSLATFLEVATVLVARGAGLRLLLSGPLSQAGLTFVASCLSEASSIALRGVFERPAPFPIEAPWRTLADIVAPSVTTALCAPIVFALVRRIEVVVAPRREEAAS